MRPNCSDCAHYFCGSAAIPGARCLRDAHPVESIEPIERAPRCWSVRLPFAACGWNGRYFTDRAEGV